ncbi:hypothetical protein OCL06_04300 [Alteromonas sp. ASW11-19]|uniref:Uncharacterized protein n=1 Tax=Alteromonas salexigens TaxID=2982530 RepID=A0ABT2VKK4_9ALTE|nr:hypothetical protein [Alteromonas salexigens]MCU7553818.1 hypothetical protein [Alteromonas salexigens]
MIRMAPLCYAPPEFMAAVLLSEITWRTVKLFTLRHHQGGFTGDTPRYPIPQANSAGLIS